MEVDTRRLDARTAAYMPVILLSGSLLSARFRRPSINSWSPQLRGLMKFCRVVLCESGSEVYLPWIRGSAIDSASASRTASLTADSVVRSV